MGLGNPGPEYARTRHNVGFLVVDALAERWGVGARDWQKKSGALAAHVRAEKTILVKPQQYMNDSGRPAQGIATFYKVAPARILVVVDDLDLPFGKLRMRADGSSGGQNGLKSLIAVFGEGFPRLRVGIGRGHDHGAIDRVLGSFTPDERETLPTLIERAVDGVSRWRRDGIVAAMNQVNAPPL